MSTIPTSWTIANWFIDPINGFDGYTGQNSVFTSGNTGPLKTWAQLQARWTTSSPRLQQNTTITFMNSQPDATDPVYFNPYIENGAAVILKGNLGATQQIATGTISATGFVVKNRSTPALLQANTGATAINQLVVNSTHSSRAWTSKSLGAGVFAMSQPLVPVVVPGAILSATSVDTWVSGDSVTVYAPTTVFVGEIKPKIENFNVSDNNLALFVYQLNISTPTNGGNIVVNPLVSFIESSIFSSSFCPIIFEGGARQGLIIAQVNSVFKDLSGIDASSSITLLGGRLDFTEYFANITVNNDIILGIAAGSTGMTLTSIFSSSIGSAYIDTGTTLNIVGIFNNTSPILWGDGALNIKGNGRFTYPAGAGAAVAAFLLTGGITINNGTTAFTNVGTNPVVTYGGITINATNLDAAASASGFGGLAYNPGGGSITNGGV